MENKSMLVFILIAINSIKVLGKNENPHKTLLSGPRFHFHGSFIADVATVNNKIENYDINRFVSHHALPSFHGGNGGYNPSGTNGFLLKDVSIKQVCYNAGLCTRNQSVDSVLGKPIQDDSSTSTAKMVDIDPLEQRFTQIWALKINIPGFFAASTRVLSMGDLWKRQILSISKETGAGTFHGTLTDIKWSPDAAKSKLGVSFEQSFKKFTKSKLSLRFVLDLYDQRNNMGRIYGTIGCHEDNVPSSKLFGRVLIAQETKIYHDAIFSVDENEKKIVFDFGNSFPTDENGMIIRNETENFVIAFARAQTDILSIKNCLDDFQIIGIVPLMEHTWLENEAGFVSFDVTNTEMEALRNRPVVVIKVKGEASKITCKEIILKEAYDGIYLHPLKHFILKKESGDTLKVKIVASRFGKPQSGIEVGFFHDKPNKTMKYSCCEPRFELPNGLISNHMGIVELNVALPKLNTPRKLIDGQLYRIAYYPKKSYFESIIRMPDIATRNAIILRVFDHVVSPANVTWVDHVFPLFKQYANLYPVMKGITFNMENYHSVLKFKNMIKTSMNLPMSHSSYMPVNRDLSVRKRRMVMEWLAKDEPTFGAIENLVNIQHLRELLQAAVEVEHSTIPLYLTALWSIKDGYNLHVHRIIKTIIKQEMLHMALAANVLNAVGGQPSFIHSTFILQYPSKLPGGVAPDLIVSLEKLSPHLIENVFMKIEKPDLSTENELLRKAIFRHTKLSFLHKKCKNGSQDKSCQKYVIDQLKTSKFSPLHQGCPIEVEKYMAKIKKANSQGKDFLNYKSGIASFYTRVLFVLAKLTNCGANSSIFTGDPKRQVSTENSYGNGKLFKVTDYFTAVEAIKTIIEEGEGTSKCDPAVHYSYKNAHDDLSHYALFDTIIQGHQINIKRKAVKKPNKSWNATNDDCKNTKYSYTGKSIQYIPSATWPILKNAKETDYKKGSPAKMRGNIFARLYNRLLGALHKSFNGEREYFVNSLFLMYSVDYYGRQLVKVPVDVKTSSFVGPNSTPIFKWIKTDVKTFQKKTGSFQKLFHKYQTKGNLIDENFREKKHPGQIHKKKYSNNYSYKRSNNKQGWKSKFSNGRTEKQRKRFRSKNKLNFEGGLEDLDDERLEKVVRELRELRRRKDEEDMIHRLQRSREDDEDEDKDYINDRDVDRSRTEEYYRYLREKPDEEDGENEEYDRNKTELSEDREEDEMIK